MAQPARKSMIIVKKSCFYLTIILLFVELQVLMSVKDFNPSGIAPAVFYHLAPDFVKGNDGRDWVEFDPATLTEIRARAEESVGDIRDLPDMEVARILRDWVRTISPSGPELMKVRDPCEILDSIERGVGANCAPLSVLYLAALTSFDIPTRRVAFFATPGDFHKAHTSVEIWNGDKWVIQDPTFNAVALGESGEMLGACEIQEYYAEGLEVIWNQDATPTEPHIEEYHIAPSNLTRTTFIHLHSYPVDQSLFQSRLVRLGERITGNTQSIIISRGEFPVSNFYMSGLIDRILLVAALVLILIAMIPFPNTGDRR